MDDLAFAHDIVKTCLRKGASQSEVYIETGEEFSVTVRHGKTETLKQASARGLGLRIFYKKRTGYSYTNDFCPKAIHNLIQTTLELAKSNVADPCNTLPQPDEPVMENLEIFDETIDTVTVDQKITLAQKLDQLVFDADPRVIKNEGAHVSNGQSYISIANSNGLAVTYRHSSAGLSVSPVAREHELMYNGHWYSYARQWAQVETAETVALTAVQRTTRMLGARKIGTVKVPVIFEPATAVTFLSSFFKTIDGDHINRGLSFLAGKLGQKIAAESLSIIDDGLIKGRLGTRPFDGEGVRPVKKKIIDQGYLRAYVYDHKAAEKAKTISTGHAHRDYTSTPSIGPNNFYIAAGNVTPATMIRETPRGLLVTGLMGFGFDPVTGTFSFGAEGLWIEQGELAYPVHEIVLSSAMQDMLLNLSAIGDDLEFRGPVSSPSLKIDSMTLSGN